MEKRFMLIRKFTCFSCLVFTLFACKCLAQMQSVTIPPDPNGVFCVGGRGGPYINYWTNNTGQNVYVWGAQQVIMTNLAIPPAGSMRASGNGDDFVHYLQSICDISAFLQIVQTGQPLLTSGWDHYDNPNSPLSPPVWFPRPFLLYPGWSIEMYIGAENEYQIYYGGTIVVNTLATIYYTVGQP